MKLSFCSIAFRRQKYPLTAIIPRLAEIGYAGIEIWANHLGEGESNIESVLACLEENEMAVPMLSPYFNVTGNEADWEATLIEAKTSFKHAIALKTSLVRTFTGFLGSDEVDTANRRLASDRLTFLCDLAAECNLELALETHPRTLVDNVDSIHKLLNDVARDNLVLNLDIYHMWEKHQNPEWIWGQLKPYVRHVHAKNALIPPSNGEEYPLFHDKRGLQEIGGVVYLGDGNMDYKPFLAALARDGYKGWISVEWFGGDPYNAAAHELDWLSNEIRTTV